MSKKKLPKDAEIVYYFYYHGDLDWKYKVMNYIENKNFDAFMREFKIKKKDKWTWLPKEASVFSKSDDDYFESIDITKKENFEKISYGDAECG